MSNRKEIHDRVLHAKTKDELTAAYGEWADAYDKDLVTEMGYVAHLTAAKLLSETLKETNARILDAGCGTGLVGEALYQMGYKNLFGLDYSQHMLDQAEKKGVYKTLRQGDLTQRLDLDDNSFDSVISVGTFTCGHVGPEALTELIRLTRPDGYICFTVREQAWQEDDYASAIKEIESRKLWRKIKHLDTDYILKEGASCTICLYQVTG